MISRWRFRVLRTEASWFQVHAIFGYTLMAAGVCRIIEICFVLKEGHGSDTANGRLGQMSAFQHLTPFLLIVGG